MRSVILQKNVFRNHHKNLNEDRLILSAAKCSPGILVSGKSGYSTQLKLIRTVASEVKVQKFRRGSLKREVKLEWGC